MPLHPRSRRLPPLRRVVRWLLMGIALYYAACTLGLVYLRFFPPVVTMVQLQRALESPFVKGPYSHRAEWVELDALPAHVGHAVIAAEDGRFYLHRGFDWEELDAARRQAERRNRPPRGASTITQQLVKNLFLTTHRSYVRKGIELSLTPLAELILPKRRILELYLNVVEWGPGVYGIEAASRYHYRKPARRLTREQAARLAAILPAPRRRTPARMGAYASVVEARMRAHGW
ncbi:MAG TPA: monofunctional biosynthetic peptidoglycan transglycosylase [Gemmatimonadaceae bacterium]|nr:monofunctional biosynthetic peptidoglycan transglycosylase [Gemmatimonadaceae bacterium]